MPNEEIRMRVVPTDGKIRWPIDGKNFLSNKHECTSFMAFGTSYCPGAGSRSIPSWPGRTRRRMDQRASVFASFVECPPVWM